MNKAMSHSHSNSQGCGPAKNGTAIFNIMHPEDHACSWCLQGIR
jgi:hypothetical protein